MPVVSNTSPLIWLAKIGRIILLKRLFSEVTIPEEVYREAVEKGLKEGFSDALAIKECIEQGWIKISKLNESEIKLCKKMMEHAFEIHLGEVQAIYWHAESTRCCWLMNPVGGHSLKHWV